MFAQAELQKIKFQIERRYPIENLMDAKLITWIEPEIDSMILHMSSNFWSERLQEQIVEYPATWLDAFKKQYFPKMQINYKRVHLTVDNVYPKLHHKIQMPEEEHFLNISKWTE